MEIVLVFVMLALALALATNEFEEIEEDRYEK